MNIYTSPRLNRILTGLELVDQQSLASMADEEWGRFRNRANILDLFTAAMIIPLVIAVAVLSAVVIRIGPSGVVVFVAITVAAGAFVATSALYHISKVSFLTKAEARRREKV